MAVTTPSLAFPPLSGSARSSGAAADPDDVTPRCIRFAFPGVPGVHCAFQTRRGGISDGPWAGGNISYEVGDDPAAVAANRAALAASLDLAEWVEAKQVHGDAMIIDPEPVQLAAALAATPVAQADGLATARPGVGLVIKTADCQPILLAHESGRYVAALHAGWRGNRIGFPQSGVRAFCERYGFPPREVLAVRGPSLGPAAAEFVNFATEWGQDFARWFRSATRTMDLWTLTRHQLAAAGLLPERIFGLDLCTHALPDDFFSYRRAATTGRQASIIWMEG